MPNLRDQLCPRFLEWIDHAALDRLDAFLAELRACGDHIAVDVDRDPKLHGPLTVGDLRELHTMIRIVSMELDCEGRGAQDEDQERRLRHRPAEGSA